MAAFQTHYTPNGYDVLCSKRMLDSKTHRAKEVTCPKCQAMLDRMDKAKTKPKESDNKEAARRLTEKLHETR